jgi:beta-glucosidase
VPIAAEDRGGIAAAVEAARSADCVILCLGEAAGMSGEAASRARIDLPGCQDELFTAVAETARPLVVLLFSGRPLAAPDVFARADAVLACWFPGSEAGHAIADVVAGKASPVGRLPVTWPRHVGQVPIYFAERTGGRPENPADKYTSRYLDLPNTPEFPFGHGLGYGDVVFSDLAVDVGEGLAVSLTASNRGARDDETVVFLFIRDPVASVARPALELKDFARLRLAAGESVRMTFTITREQLSFLDRHLAPVFEGGDFEILAGPSADRGRLLSTTVTYR